MRVVAAIGVAVALMVAPGNPAVVGRIRAAAVAVAQSQEYAAVQALVGPALSARLMLFPVLHATGADATADAAVLGFTPDGFLAAQRHPVQMMDAIQRYFQQFKGAPDAVASITTINQQFGFLDLSAVSAPERGAIIMRLLTRSPASAYLRTLTRRPSCSLPRGSHVAQVFCPVVAFAPTNHVPLYLPSWFPPAPTPQSAYVVANNHQLWYIAVTSQGPCAPLSCAAWYIQGARGISMRPMPDAVVDLGANGKGLLYLNRGSNSAPTVEWTRGGNTYTALGVDDSATQTALLRILRSLVRSG